MTATATPLWAIAPFILYLLLIAIMPLFFGAFWEHNRNKFLVAVVLSAPVVGYLILARGPRGGEELLRTACDYASFMALLGALFTISGGICLRGSLAGAWWVNLGFLAVGAVLGSIIGTTGASVLLIRPLLRANARRGYVTHIVVFFIFIVSNAAGLLTPLGDPPLFLGFLRGVPFTWTLRLLPAWAMVNGILLAVFSVIDRYLVLRERRRPRPAQLPVFDAAADDDGPLHLDGGLNFVWLLGIVAGPAEPSVLISAFSGCQTCTSTPSAARPDARRLTYWPTPPERPAYSPVMMCQATINSASGRATR